MIEREAQFEVRDYQSYVVAETFVDGSFNAGGNEGFERLFRYISGASRAAEKITMTSPVEQQRAGARWRIAFVLPASYTLAKARRPTDDRVVLAEAPPRRMAAVRYRGTWSGARYAKQLAALRKFIGERGLTEVGEPVFCAP